MLHNSSGGIASAAVSTSSPYLCMIHSSSGDIASAAVKHSKPPCILHSSSGGIASAAVSTSSPYLCMIHSSSGGIASAAVKHSKPPCILRIASAAVITSSPCEVCSTAARAGSLALQPHLLHNLRCDTKFQLCSFTFCLCYPTPCERVLVILRLWLLVKGFRGIRALWSGFTSRIHSCLVATLGDLRLKEPWCRKAPHPLPPA